MFFFPLVKLNLTNLLYTFYEQHYFLMRILTFLDQIYNFQEVFENVCNVEDFFVDLDLYPSDSFVFYLFNFK